MGTIDITPSPRVLRMLGQIDFQPWQCLAELVDNSIDAFIDQVSAGIPSINPRIDIQLPSEAELQSGSGTIIIKDNAGGMMPKDLMNAVRAGYSGNDPVEKMGLFGMGFNISTARMGRRTEVWTTKVDDADWTGIIIDFDSLERQKTFHAPMENRRKSPSEIAAGVHGTEIRITHLEADRVRTLTRGIGKRKTRDKLGKIYGRVMGRLGIEVNYDGDRVSPYKHCAWGGNRSVETQSFGRVPARIDIDVSLQPKRFCTTCWVWLQEDDDICPSCGLMDNVIERKRQLKGWIGVQRYFDKEHYGVDLIRNGRVIEELNKSFFMFIDENGGQSLEYPIDATHWGGRIIGELEIDFVRVSHQKDAFDKLDPEWKKVVEIVRGNSPLQPKIAERMGLGRNESPLARLFAGYRKGYAGLKDLVPGLPDGSGLNSGLVQEYVERFYEGDSAYQADDKWYELVLQAEKGKRGASAGAVDAAGDFPMLVQETPIGEYRTPTGGQAVPPPRGNVQAQQVDAELDEELSGAYRLDELPGDIVVKVAAYRHNKDIGGKPFAIEPAGYEFRFDFNPRSSFFEEGMELPADCLIIDLAQHFLSLSGQSPRTHPVSSLSRILRGKYFPSSCGDLASSAAAAGTMISELRRHFDENLPEAAPIDINMIPSGQLSQIKRSALQAEGLKPQDVEALVAEGKFSRFVASNFVIELMRHWPGLATDGRFFSSPYSGLPEDLKDLTLNELADALQDILWLSDEAVSAISKDAAWKLRYAKAIASLKLLQFKRT